MAEIPKGSSIRLETYLTSYREVKYNQDTGEIEVGGKKYEVLVKHGGQYKSAHQKLSKEELKNLISSIESLFKDTEIEFFSLSDVVIDEKGVHASDNQEKVKIVKDTNLSTLAQKVTQLAKGVQFSEPAPTVPKKIVVEKEIGEKEEYTPLNKSIPDLLQTASKEKFDSQTIIADQFGAVENTITALGTIDKRGVKGSLGYSAEYDFLSNFYKNPNGYSIPLKQLLYLADINPDDENKYESYASLPSMEHYYQAIKVLGIQDTETRQKAFAEVVKAKTPGDAKGVAKKYESDLKQGYWSDGRVADSLNLILMYKFVKDPFANKIKLTEEGKQLLVMTEGKAIIEGIQGKEGAVQDQRCAMELHSDSKGGYEFRGKNMLGKKLVQIRDLLLEEFEVKDTSE